MKILITTGSFYPAQEGGPTNALYWLASGLAHRGYDVHVVASSKGLSGQVPLDTWQELNGFRVIYNSPGKGEDILHAEIGWSECLIRSGVCVMKAHLSNLKYLKRRKKLILSPRGEVFYPAIFHKGKIFGLLKFVFFKIMGLLYGNRIIYHATSEEEKEQIQKIFGRKRRIFTAPNYMIIPDYIDDSLRTDEYKDLIYVGRIAPIKALDKLIKALSLSKAFLNNSSKLHILGECNGDYYDYLTQKIDQLNLKNKVVFHGVVTGRDKDLLIANSRYLMLISESENFGNVVIEALSQGTPVIASKGTPWSELEDKDAGFWVSNKPEELSVVIDKVLQMDEEQYNTLRRNAYQYSKMFDVYSNMEVWSSIIDCLHNSASAIIQLPIA